MKCPFKKTVYVKNCSFFDGFPQEQIIEQEFGECEKEECAMWNQTTEICGLPTTPFNINQMDWRLP